MVVSGTPSEVGDLVDGVVGELVDGREAFNSPSEVIRVLDFGRLIVGVLSCYTPSPMANLA